MEQWITKVNQRNVLCKQFALEGECLARYGAALAALPVELVEELLLKIRVQHRTNDITDIQVVMLRLLRR